MIINAANIEDYYQKAHKFLFDSELIIGQVTDWRGSYFSIKSGINDENTLSFVEVRDFGGDRERARMEAWVAAAIKVGWEPNA